MRWIRSDHRGLERLWVVWIGLTGCAVLVQHHKHVTVCCPPPSHPTTTTGDGIP
jgi:hypothetical protein